MADKIQRGTSSNLIQDDKLKVATQLALPVKDDFTDDEVGSIALDDTNRLKVKGYDEVVRGVANLEDVTAVSGGLTQEIQDREGGDATNATAISNEVDRATAAEQVNANTIALEVTRAIAAESLLQEDISNLNEGFLGAEPSDTPVSNVNIYKSLSDGTYTNFGGLVVSPQDLLDGDVQLVRSVAGTWTKRVIPVDLANYYIKSEIYSKTEIEDIVLKLSTGVPVDLSLGVQRQPGSYTVPGDLGNSANWRRLALIPVVPGQEISIEGVLDGSAQTNMGSGYSTDVSPSSATRTEQIIGVSGQTTHTFVVGENTYFIGINFLARTNASTITEYDDVIKVYSPVGTEWKVDHEKLDVGVVKSTDYEVFKGNTEDEIDYLDQQINGTASPLLIAGMPALRYTSQTTTTAADLAQTNESDKLKLKRAGTNDSHINYVNTLYPTSDYSKITCSIEVQEINSANPAIIVGYGDFSGNAPLGVCYRASGQLFTTNPYSTASLTSQVSFVVGDVITVEMEVATGGASSRIRFRKNSDAFGEWVNVNIPVAGNFLIGVRGAMAYTFVWTLNLTDSVSGRSQAYTDQKVSSVGVGAKIAYVSKAGSDSNFGTQASPFLTISKAISYVSTAQIGIITILGGDYRETINLTAVDMCYLKIANYNNEFVRVMGSTQLVEFTKTSGYTNIYEAAYAATVPNQTRDGKRIFEDGRPSKVILTDERHALQKSLSHRLPYTEIGEIAAGVDLPTTLTSLDASAGKFYHSGEKIYIHTTDSSDPSANGYAYEVQSRPVLTPPSIVKNLTLELSNIASFYSSSYAFDFFRIPFVIRNYCIAVASANNGFSDDCNVVKAYFDEAAGCGNDGAGGHINRRAGYASLNPRSASNSAFYVDPWYHDNRDDGISHHELGEGTGMGGLFEYNGKAGLIPANGCNWRQYGGVARKNIYGVFIGNPIDTRPFAVTRVENFESYDNNYNYRASGDPDMVLELKDCRSKNATTFELYASDGATLISKNTLVSQIDPTKIKGASTGGIILIQNEITLVS